MPSDHSGYSRWCWGPLASAGQGQLCISLPGSGVRDIVMLAENFDFCKIKLSLKMQLPWGTWVA